MYNKFFYRESILLATFFAISITFILCEYFGILQINNLLFTPLYFICLFLLAVKLAFNFLLKKNNPQYNKVFFNLTLIWLSTTALISLAQKTTLVVDTLLWRILLTGTLFFLCLCVLFSVKQIQLCVPILGKKYLYGYLLIILTIGGFILRIYNLDHNPPLTDEFYHLLAAKRFMLEGYFEYSRGIFVTYLVGYVFDTLNETSVYYARIIPVIFGTASIPLMYILWRRLNPFVGIISAGLLCTMPLAVGMSRFVREYSFFLFYLLAHTIILTAVIRSVTDNFIQVTIKLLLLFSIPVSFYIFVEDSNFVPLLFIYSFIVVIVNLLHKLSLDYIKTLVWKNKMISVSALTVTLGILFYIFTKLTWLIKIKLPEAFFNLPYLNYFDALFSPNFSPWGVKYLWFSGANFNTYFILGICLLGFLMFLKNKYYQISFLILLVTLIPFLYFAERYYAIRYIYYVIPFYILIISCGIYSIFYSSIVFPSKIKRTTYIISVAVLLATVFSISPTLSGLQNEGPGLTDQKRELHSYDYQSLFKKLEELGFVDGDPLIASDGINNGITFYLTNYEFITDRENHPLLRYALKNVNGELVSFNDTHTVYAYHYDVEQFYAYPCADVVCNVPEDERISMIMKEQKRGWFLIDKDRNRNWNPDGYPLKNFMLGEVYINYLESTDGFRGIDIYHWTYSS